MLYWTESLWATGLNYRAFRGRMWRGLISIKNTINLIKKVVVLDPENINLALQHRCPN